MSEVKRYTEIFVGNLSAVLLKCEDGQYVKHKDYARVEAENIKLRMVLESAKKCRAGKDTYSELSAMIDAFEALEEK